MTAPCKIGLLDSGVGTGVACSAATCIELNAEGECVYGPARPDQLGHGHAIARIILSHAPRTELVNAQIFHETLTTSPALIAEGLSWALDQGARLITMSLGVRADRAVLRDACSAALEAGCILVAATPARGPHVFPAHYDGVIRVMGDARCGPNEISALMTARAHFGAPPQASDILEPDHALRGSSCATAQLAGHAAALLETDPQASAQELIDTLAQAARYHGPEQRS